MLIDAYLNRLRLAGYRPSTVLARGMCLRAFEKSLEAHQATVRTAGRLEVEAFLARDLAPESRRAYRGHLRGLYVWALDEGHVTSDPTAKLPAIRVPRAVPRPILANDLRKAVDNADPRMRAWLLLMAMSGLRCLEVAALRPEDVSVVESGPVLFLRECKGGGTATVPTHEAVLHALMQLTPRSGLWWDVTPHYVSTTVSGYLRAVGVNATAHRLRHSAGTEFYRASGHDLLATARMLRHASVRTTQVYAEIDVQRPAQVMRAMQVPGVPQMPPAWGSPRWWTPLEDKDATRLRRLS